MIEQDITRIATALERIAAALEGQVMLPIQGEPAQKKVKKPKTEELAPAQTETPALTEAPAKPEVPAQTEAPAKPEVPALSEQELRDKVKQLAMRLAKKPAMLEEGKKFLMSLGMTQVSVAAIPADKLEAVIEHFNSLLAP